MDVKKILSKSINIMTKLTNDKVVKKYLQDIFKILNSFIKIINKLRCIE